MDKVNIHILFSRIKDSKTKGHMFMNRGEGFKRGLVGTFFTQWVVRKKPSEEAIEVYDFQKAFGKMYG